MTLIDAAASGDRRSVLEQLRSVLAVSIVEVDPDKRAPLAKQLRDTLAELDALPDGKEDSTSDDLTARRNARRAASTSAHPASGSAV